MATKTQAARTLATVIPFWKVAWFKELNLARLTGDYGDENENKEAYQSLVDQDWWIDDNGMIKVEAISDELKARALKERETQFEELKTASKVDAKKVVELSLFEELYTDGKGKVLPPEYTGLTANRRSQLIFKAKLERRNANQPVGNELPVIVMSFDTPLERLAAQIQENEGKLSGLKEMSNADRLLAARNVLQLGGREADLTRVFKRGMSQKLWNIVMLDSRFPNIGIVRRMCLPATDEKFISWGVDKEDTRALILRTDSQALEAHNNKLVTQGKEALKPAVEDDVTAYFAAPKAQGGNQTKIMKRETIEGLSANFPAIPLRKMAKAVIDNNVDGLKPYQIFAPAFNGLEDLIEQGDGPGVETIVVKLARAGKVNRTNLYKEIEAILTKAGV